MRENDFFAELCLERYSDMHFWSSIISYLNQNRKFNHLIMVCNFKKGHK